MEGKEERPNFKFLKFLFLHSYINSYQTFPSLYYETDCKIGVPFWLTFRPSPNKKIPRLSRLPVFFPLLDSSVHARYSQPSKEGALQSLTSTHNTTAAAATAAGAITIIQQQLAGHTTTAAAAAAGAGLTQAAKNAGASKKRRTRALWRRLARKKV